MTNHRDHLPQLDAAVFLTDGGIETTLIFAEGLDLPDFAAFHLLRSEEGTEALRRYFRTYVELAASDGVGIVLETPTWRASPDWGARLGYTAEQLIEANRRSVALVEAVRDESSHAGVVVSGCVGPRGDGYVVGDAMSVDEARSYHGVQIGALADAGVDMIGAITMTYPDEAIGVAAAAMDAGVPAAISFTVETDGRLPSGPTLGEAIDAVDAATGSYPAYFMVNCAHPSHFSAVLDPAAPWAQRIRGLRANASRMSHAELDEADELDPGDPDELAAEYVALRQLLPRLNVVGGCCGTDHRHIGAISRAFTAG